MANLKGIKYAVITSVISGVSIFINKYAVGTISPPLVFTAVKNSIVGIIIVALILMTKKIPQIKLLTRKEWVNLILIALVGGTIPFYLFFTGLSTIPAVNSAMIHKTLVLWIAVLALPLLKEKLSQVQILAILILFTGNLIFGGFEGFKFSTGEAMVLMATILWAIENILAKKVLPTVDPDIVAGIRMGVGSLILLIASTVYYPESIANMININMSQFFWLALTAVALTAYTLTWYRALKYAPATIVAGVLVSSTLVTNLLSVIFVTRNWTFVNIFQNFTIAVGLGLLLWQVLYQSNKTNSQSLA